ncbi:MAG: exodeoxyribonuclease III [Anaerolineales bacterium]|nr:exodeoxyribonuclease III [Anaerolineales bacterium]
MKIVSWNVNGLRAAISKRIWDWITFQNAEIVCLQEIKVKPEQLDNEQLNLFSEFTVVWAPAERSGYSGVATAMRNHRLDSKIGLGISRYDSEGRIIQSKHPGFYLFNVYFPNGQRDLGRLTYKLDFYADFLEHCDQLHAKGESIVICGDFNTAHNEIDLKNPKQNEKTSGFLPEERAWIDRYLEHGFVDVYRYLHPDEVKYTWWTYRFGARQRNIGWRLDYFLVSEKLISAVSEVNIHQDVLGSDHCPISLKIDL